ncbi:hypothetical protein PsorP6_011275 [Peronosclerospora sorghi]|uniref:Uncharacterized protein n=1 Tax=Peronosclerospora sorghi TaxID=230839 RepID=A0ACC0WM84_9STRA|nr:hypothetical protein PsorP6_011275 [Peronosclerospora sorghi]
MMIGRNDDRKHPFCVPATCSTRVQLESGQSQLESCQLMDVKYSDQTAFEAAANGDFPLLVLLWGMAMGMQPQAVDLLAMKDPSGNSLVHYAAASGEDTCESMHFLMQQMHALNREQVLVDAPNDAGETPLMYARLLHGKKGRAAHAGNLRLADSLLRSGYVDLLAQDARGNTAAHHAAAQGHLWVLHYLLEAEKRRYAAVAKKEEQVWTPRRLGGYSFEHRSVLHYACMSEYKPMVQYLLTREYDATEADAHGQTCLDLATQRNVLWLEHLLRAKTKATDPPTHMRPTRKRVAMLHGTILCAILATSYWLVWWLAVPVILVALGKSLSMFRQKGHGHGGHSHGSASKTATEGVHPSKRNVVVPMNVSLERIEQSPTEGMAAQSRKMKEQTSVGWHTLTKAQPESAMGIWLAWVGLFALFYVVLWVDSTYQHFQHRYRVFLGITGALQVLFLLVWSKLAFLWPVDPGQIATYEQDVETMLNKAARVELLHPSKFCRTCLVMKPLRSKHCAQCGICIARHDHHCIWINRCVGYGNHRLFFVFLVVHAVVVGIYAALAVLVLSDVTKKLHQERVGTTSDRLSAMDVWIEVPSLVSHHLLVLIVLLWSVVVFLALAIMTSQHVNNIEKNLTINEKVNWRRYAYMTSASPTTSGKIEMANPFDRGVKCNVMEFFVRSGKFAMDYHHVFTVPTPESELTSPFIAAGDENAKERGDRTDRDHVV